jgi:maltooligosyltrehalose trehalohydrolase
MFFTDFGDPQLAEAVRKGRRAEFPEFHADEVPDPQSEATFRRSKLDWNLNANQEQMLKWYRWLLGLRKAFVARSSRKVKVAREGGRITLEVGDAPNVVRVSAMVVGTHDDTGAKIFRYDVQGPWGAKDAAS